MKKEIIIFIWVILILGCFVKVSILMDDRDFWHDEAFQVVYSTKPLSFIMDSNDVHPPLYNLMTRGMVNLGIDSIFIFRLSSVLFSLIFIYVFYWLMIEFFNPKIAMISTSMLSFSYTYLYYATEFRNYAFVLALVVIQIYYFNLQLKTGKGAFLYLLFSAFMVYSHYLAGLIIVTQFIYLILFEKDVIKHNQEKLYQSYLWLFIISIPLFVYLFRTMPKIVSFWFHDIDFISLISTFFYILAPPIENYHYGFGIFYILLFGTMIYYWKKIDKLYIQFTMYLFVPIVLMWTISQFFPFYHHRYFIFGGISFFVLVAWGIDKLEKTYKSIDMFALACWMVLFTMGFSTFVGSFDHEISHAGYFLQNETKDMIDVAIIHETTFSQTPMKIYLPNARHYLLTNLSKANRFTAGGSATWDDEIITNINQVHAQNIYAVSHNKIFKWTIFEEGGLYVTKD